MNTHFQPRCHRHKHADARRQKRRRTEDQDEQRNDFGRVAHREKIAHHRHGRHRRGAAAQRLHKTPCDQPFHIARQHAGDGCQHEQSHARIQRRFAPKTVKQRAINKLRRRKAGEVAGKRKRNPRRGRVQAGGHFRKRRQIHVNRERADGGQRAENENDQRTIMGL